MGRAPCCDKIGLKKGPWTRDEDQILINYINENGHVNWRALPKRAGLLRCGKSCRLRWINYLRPDIKRGNFTKEEEDTIIDLHKELGNKWSAIAAKLPGRTDNEIKNIWHTHLKKKLDPPPEPVKRVRKRSKSKKDSQSAKQQGGEEAMMVENVPAHTAGEAKTEEDHARTEEEEEHTNLPSQSSSSENSSSITNASTGSDSMSETFQKSVEVADDFWADMISGGDYSTSHFTGELPGLSNSGGEPQFESIQTTGHVYDFDPIMPEDMEFWYNIFTRDGEIRDLLLDL